MVGRGNAALLALAMSAPVAATAQSPDAPDLLQETYRDWIVRCETPPPADDGIRVARACEMVQEIRQAGTNQRVLTVALQATELGAALVLVTPFGLRLSDGVAIEVETDRVAEIGFRTCLPQGCIANAILEDATIARLASGDTVDVIMTSDAGQTVSLSVSLSGFSAAWSRLAALKVE